MYAVIKTGGKQYKVSKDDVISVEKLSDDAGKKIKLNEVLIISDKGKPIVETNPEHNISKIYLNFAQKIKKIYF